MVKQIEEGSTLELLTDDPDSKEQIADWCRESGCVLRAVSEEHGELHFIIDVRH